MKQLAASFVRFIRNERGTTAIEYALIAGLISIVIVGAVTAVGVNVGNLFASILPGLG
ncbi:Flp family type IVb pilin [Bosea sp. BH3]|uniref:Flp family type IVb pilin n=1 Tax=Bosea sp. BH3 TaxID=2871701 RepID=UPI0021CB2534|nr:Flp family type IVb pilin [Bosea sp. BH3]MCU4179108.1 Flp family type IVb pilin [Bosea sp. BH3]